MAAQGDGFVPSKSAGLPCDGGTDVFGEGDVEIIQDKTKCLLNFQVRKFCVCISIEWWIKSERMCGEETEIPAHLQNNS